MNGMIALDPDLLSVHRTNVRSTQNPSFRKIKESIRADAGANLIFTVSRESENHSWNVVDGFGTRLKAVQQLKAENTLDANPYSEVICRPVPWREDLDNRISSFRENTARGDVSFAEACDAVEDIRHDWERSCAVDKPSDSDFRQFADANGMTLSRSGYSRMRATHQLLLPVLPKSFYQGRALDSSARLLLTHRSEASRVIANTDQSLSSIILSKQDARSLYDEHFKKSAEKLDSPEMEPGKLIASVNKRLSGALCIEQNHFEARLKNKSLPPPPTPTPTPRDPLVQKAIDLVGDGSPGVIASHFDTADTFDSALLVMSNLDDKDVLALLEPIRNKIKTTQETTAV